MLNQLTSPGNPPIARLNQVEDWSVQLESVIAHLDKTTQELERRVSAVARTAPPSCEKDNHPDETLVPLADRLRAHTRNIAALERRIADLVTRIEL